MPHPASRRPLPFGAQGARTLALLTACGLIVSPLRADDQHGPLTDIAGALPTATTSSLFHIDKSENRNQVHYAAHVDDACRPLGGHPIYGYWRELERGPSIVSALLERERPAYGLAEPRRIERWPAGGRVQLSLRALPARPVTIELFRAGASCAARAFVAIQKQVAMLTSVYVDMGPLFSVDRVVVRGLRLVDGAAIAETLQP